MLPEELTNPSGKEPLLQKDDNYQHVRQTGLATGGKCASHLADSKVIVNELMWNTGHLPQ